eukprot:GFUD01078845.1.p1 GENE.GFUD01078845.1~~GFUD01078845.1.p1  ORF type:complete len:297 (-),score=84.64 GFUD01078845.1:62-952(-)
MALTISEVERLKRKLRKKLRQIENLEIVDRELNDEELDKCSKKLEIRAELSEFIKVSEVKDTEDVENSFTFIEKEDYSSIETINKSTEIIREEHLGFWKLEDSEPSDEMKRKSSEHEPTNYCDKIVEKKPCLESVQTGSKPEPDKAAPVHSCDKKTDTQSVAVAPVQCSDKKTDTQPVAVPPVQPCDKRTVTQPVGSSESCGTKVKKDDRPTETFKEPQLKANQKVKPAATKPSVPSDLAKWRKVSWSVEELCGHDDLVLDCDVDINLGLAITCSRDTTVKVSSTQFVKCFLRTLS